MKNSKILTGILLSVIGLLLIILKGKLIRITATFIGVVFIINGIMTILNNVLTKGVITIVIGAAIILFGWLFITIALYIVGALLIVYGVLDFRFRNNQQYPIRIESSISGGSLKIDICGIMTNHERTVDIETETVVWKSFLPGVSLKSLSFDAEGNLLMGTDAGLDVFDIERDKHRRIVHDTRNARSLSNNIIFDILCDRDPVLSPNNTAVRYLPYGGIICLKIAVLY
jgi:hypothetical protein